MDKQKSVDFGGALRAPEEPYKQVSKTKRSSRRRKKKTSSDNAITDEVPPDSSSPTFSGRCKELEGHIYDVGANQADRYIKTTKELEQYLRGTFTPEALKSIEELTLVSFTEPSMPVDDYGVEIDDDELTYIQKTILGGRIKEYLYETKEFAQDMVKIYITIHGQCTDAMIQKLETDQHYETVKEESDATGLLKMIKKICYNYQNEATTTRMSNSRYLP
jgi:hypothetical protein